MAQQVNLRLDSIFLDARLQLREPDPRVVTQYAEYFDCLPPVTVYQVDDLLILVDGYHRYTAALSAGLEEIPAVVHEGKTYKEALWEGAICNATHGVPLNGAAKEKAVENRLMAWPERANQWIADDLTVSREYVEGIRVRLEDSDEIDTAERLLGRDGTWRPRIYVSRDDEIEELLAQGLADRDISRRLGISARVVARVRQGASSSTAALTETTSAAPPKVGFEEDPDYPPPGTVPERRVQEPEETLAEEPTPGRLERRRAELAAAPAYDEGVLRGRLVQGDCLDLLAADRNTYDLILTDPPYGVKENTDWDITDPNEFAAFTHAWLEPTLIRLSPSGRIYIFWTGKHWALLCNIIDQINNDLHLGLVPGIHLIWQHNDTNRLFYDEKDVKPNYDPILHWHGPEVENLRYTDPWVSNDRRGAVWTAMRDFNRVHEAEKPLSIVRDIVRMTTYPNDLVLDPFMGSGTTAVACEQLGRRWVGYEQDADTVRLAQQRIMLEQNEQA